MLKRLFQALLCLSVMSQANAESWPKGGFVPDEETAINIAVAVWTPIYGKERIEGQKPYVARLENGVWHVTGSLPEIMPGGVANILINKQDARILNVSHTK